MNTNNILIENYFGLLSGLGRENKIRLIARLSNSIIEDKKNKSEIVDTLFGSFISDKTDDELINEIKNSRHFNRQIESF